MNRENLTRQRILKSLLSTEMMNTDGNSVSPSLYQPNYVTPHGPTPPGGAYKPTFNVGECKIRATFALNELGTFKWIIQTYERNYILSFKRETQPKIKN